MNAPTDPGAAPVVPPIREDDLPGHESGLEPRPDFAPRYPGSGRLAGQVAIVTGADSGIGRAVAVLFAREGARVTIAYLCEDGDADETRRLVAAEGSEALLVRGDLGEPDHAAGIVTATVDR